MPFKEITAEQAWILMQQGAILADIRDDQRFHYSHAKGAFHLTNQSFLQFEQQVDYDTPIIVSCYHGISSRNVATFLSEQGYDNLYSLIGGFEAWEKSSLPLETAYEQS
ncbi:thiosulfate sulfurtransferase GlpE [Rodentibacter caecimuris]|uniref:Thiosulfate sulfurtransferase GlpE n=1 Tax=Rodentibacter caecimuris TaxID=1796644 RepID=A0ABX3L3K3_9PAST|nr:thiosulfate sulfurtransferase [Rodentibacter heylii]